MCGVPSSSLFFFASSELVAWLRFIFARLSVRLRASRASRDALFTGAGAGAGRWRRLIAPLRTGGAAVRMRGAAAREVYETAGGQAPMGAAAVSETSKSDGRWRSEPLRYDGGWKMAGSFSDATRERECV